MGYQRRVHGNHIILGLLGVRMIAIRLLVVVACLCAFAPSNIEAKKKMKRVEDVFCDGKKKFEVYLKAGKEYKFETAMKPKKKYQVCCQLQAGEWMQERGHTACKI